MGEDLDPLTTESTARTISHRGILIVMATVIVLAAIAGGVFAGPNFALGVLFGGAISFANYFWLDRSTKAMFDQAAIASTGILAAKYILRYAALGTVLLAVYLTNAFPIVAVILGLSAFAFAVVVQGLKNIFTSTL